MTGNGGVNRYYPWDEGQVFSSAISADDAAQKAFSTIYPNAKCGKCEDGLVPCSHSISGVEHECCEHGETEEHPA